MQIAVVVTLPLVYPVVIFRAAGVGVGELPSILSWGLLVLAVAALLQAARRPIGSGYLLPSLSSAIYLQPSVAAVGIGGRALLATMTILAGVFETGFSAVVTRFRRVFSPVVTGVIVLIVGAEIGLTAVTLGVDAVRGSEASDVVEIAISVTAFAVIVSGVVWGSLWVRNVAPIAGVVVGSVLSGIFVSIPATDQRLIAETPTFGLPGLPPFIYDFEWSLVVPFLVLGIAAGLRTVGVVMTLHQAAHPADRAPDYRAMRHGVRNDGIGAMAAGAVGFPGISSAPSAIGVSVAAGIMSRFVAVTVAAVLVVLAFCPKLLAYLVAAPAAVVSALLIYYASFMILGGIRLITRQALDVRATFIVGVSVSLAIGARVYGVSRAEDSDWLTLVAGSMMTIGGLSAVLLSIVFRIGARRRRRFTLTLDGREPVEVATDIGTTLRSMGTDAEAARSAVALTAEAVQQIHDDGLATGPVVAQVLTEGDALDVRLSYDGAPLAVEPFQALDLEQATDENVFAMGLSQYLGVTRPDDVTVTRRGGHVQLRFVYDRT